MASITRNQLATVLHSWIASAGQVTQLLNATITMYMSDSYWNPRREYHNSALTGQMWVNELIHGHPDRIRTELGVRLHVFVALIIELRTMGYGDSRNTTLEEQLAIFLYTCVTGLSIRHVGERFQRANETISKYFTRMLSIFSGREFYNRHVRLPSADDPVPRYIRNNKKLWPFFRDCVGAMDGSHIACWVSAEDRANMRNRKGFLSQNVLAICDFRMYFLYILAGWDGSVTDSFLYSDARINDLPVPAGKFYLGDAGFPLCDNVIIPYRSTRYHLREWALGREKPKTKEELYNLRHAQARNGIERIFGVIKARWQVLVTPSHYPMEHQSKIPAALAAIHNFILEHDPMEELDADAYDPAPGIRGRGQQQDIGELAATRLTEEESEEGKALRERIANDMWADYQRVVAERAAGGRDVEDEMEE